MKRRGGGEGGDSPNKKVPPVNWLCDILAFVGRGKRESTNGLLAGRGVFFLSRLLSLSLSTYVWLTKERLAFSSIKGPSLVAQSKPTTMDSLASFMQVTPTVKSTKTLVPVPSGPKAQILRASLVFQL